MESKDRSRNKPIRSALGRSFFITAVYALVGYAWIIGSELVLSAVQPESPEIFIISISKGLGFVSATAILIFILIYQNFSKLIAESKEREQSETALKEAQQIAHVGSFAFYSKNNRIEFSDEALRMLDLCGDPTPFDFETLLRHVQIEDREHVRARIFDTLENETSATFLCRVLRANEPGRTVQVRIHSSRQNKQRELQLIGTLQDLTDRVQAETAARENEAIYQALINSSYDLVYFKDSALRYIAANTNMQRYYGLHEECLLGHTISELKPDEESRIWEARDRSVLISGKPLFTEEVHGEKTFETIIFPVDMSNNKRGVGGISRDITSRRLIEAAVIEERDRAQTYFDIASILFVVFTSEGIVSMINQAGCETLGLSKNEIIGKSWVDHFVPEQDREGVQNIIRRISDGTICDTEIHENEIVTAGGEIRIIEWRNTVLHSPQGEISGMLSAGVDITELKRTMRALQESERSKSVLLANLPGMAYRCAYDRNWTMQFVSSGCFDLTGYLPNELIGNACISFNEIICQEYREPIWMESSAHLSEHQGNRYEYEILTASGERKWVLDINQGVFEPSGKLIALEGIIIDITNSKLQFLQIQYLSNHDQLTGLHNRQYYDNAKKRLDQAQYLPLSVMYVDINGLKLINDAFGSEAGDRMIQTTATILKANIRDQDIVARIGGDEFGILMPNSGSQGSIERMQTIKSAFSMYNDSVKDRAMIINLSIGYCTKADEWMDFSQVEKEAEANMARRKLFDQKSHHNAVLSSIMTTLFERSFETEEHAERIDQICAIVGRKLGLSHEEMDKLHLFAILHDIGKIGISDQILNKPSSLNEEEFAVMKTHPEIGYRIAMASPEFASIAELILTHHERWDGAGYPNRISGEKIPLLSRILAIADAYDAMTKDRIYRKALPREVAVREIKTNAGSQFDPQIAGVFLQILEQNDL
ncbi:MAG: PAS domain S-box protein [Christensenella sp.]|nr:PAS domain S-box protein [Christensenella sp.]